MTLNIMSTTE